MEKKKKKTLFCQQLLLSILSFNLIHLSTSQSQCTNPTAVRAGFWLSRSNHYSSLSNITSPLYTHIYYYSLSLDETSFKVALPPQVQLSLLANFTTAVKSDNPSVEETLVSIATDDHQTNSSAGPNLRSSFISSAIELTTAHRIDGLDLAWQFPSSPADMTNQAILLAEWRAAVKDAAKDPSSMLLLTATVYFSDHLFDWPTDDLDYPVGAISENLDWANVLCFGYHRSSKLNTAADAPLYDRTTHLSTSYGIGSWLDAGFPPCKMVMGIPLYGRSWYPKNKEKNGLGAQAVATGPREKLSNRTGMLAYIEIKEILKENTLLLTTIGQYPRNSTMEVYGSVSTILKLCMRRSSSL